MAETAAFSLDSVTVGTFALIAGAAFFGSIVSGMSGFGAGLIISAFLAPIIGVKALVPVIGVMMLFNNGSRVWFYRHGLDLRAAALVCIPAIPTAILGAIVYTRLDAVVISLILGWVLILSVPARRWLHRKEIRLGHKGLGVFGFVWGFLNSTMIGTGLLVVPVLLGAGLFSQALLATDAAIAVAINIVKAIAFGRLEVLTPALFIAACIVGLFTIPGNWVASWIVKNTSVRIHTIFMEIFITGAGFGFLWYFGRGMAWY
ncbi:MAG TPA: sulfite exporter TauE/SafE family protein [Alphaproteobacteria bacterium]|jgi:hypothetical protein